MTKGVEVDKDVAAELKALRRMKRDYGRLKLEHEILKKPRREACCVGWLEAVCFA